jgi:response regulator RpfG family c-di-GMP phosphodiesterase
MPVMDGYETILALHSDNELRQIPIIALTASSLESESTLIESYCHSYLRKPVMRTDLLQALSKILLPNDSKLSKSIPYSQQVTTQQAPIFDPSEEHNCYSISPDLFAQLKEQVFPIWDEIRPVMSNDDVEDFASRIIQLGQEFHHNGILEYGRMLSKYSLTFKIGKMQQLFLKFPSLLEKYSIEAA